MFGKPAACFYRFIVEDVFIRHSAERRPLQVSFYPFPLSCQHQNENSTNFVGDYDNFMRKGRIKATHRFSTRPARPQAKKSAGFQHSAQSAAASYPGAVAQFRQRPLVGRHSRHAKLLRFYRQDLTPPTHSKMFR